MSAWRLCARPSGTGFRVRAGPRSGCAPCPNLIGQSAATAPLTIAARYLDAHAKGQAKKRGWYWFGGRLSLHGISIRRLRWHLEAGENGGTLGHCWFCIPSVMLMCECVVASIISRFADRKWPKAGDLPNSKMVATADIRQTGQRATAFDPWRHEFTSYLPRRLLTASCVSGQTPSRS